jgi:hypothetical protein
MEREVQVRCRPEDVQITESVLQDASKEFSELIQKQCGVVFQTAVTLDGNNNLKPAECSYLRDD